LRSTRCTTVEDVLVPGIFEHVERAGIHSGDSITVYPPPQIIDAADAEQRIVEITRAIAHELTQTRGSDQHTVRSCTKASCYIIEANPRASRTVPIISKVTGR
jgi:carbamoyl-phosphate synthase large subunit